MLDEAIAWMRPEDGGSFSDWGCGTGQVAHALHDMGHPVTLVDLAANCYRGELPFVEACLWDLPKNLGATDYGYCADVMEHLPPEHVPAAIEGIAKRTRKACFFQIALFHDHFGDRIGQTLHLSVFPSRWWAKAMAPYWGRVDMRRWSNGRHLLVLAQP